MILAKRKGLEYRDWLQESMPADYHNEFVGESRFNPKWHELWDKMSASDELQNEYTTDGNDIDVDRINEQLMASAAGKKLPKRSNPTPLDALREAPEEEEEEGAAAAAAARSHHRHHLESNTKTMRLPQHPTRVLDGVRECLPALQQEDPAAALLRANGMPVDLAVGGTVI